MTGNWDDYLLTIICGLEMKLKEAMFFRWECVSLSCGHYVRRLRSQTGETFNGSQDTSLQATQILASLSTICNSNASLQGSKAPARGAV